MEIKTKIVIPFIILSSLFIITNCCIATNCLSCPKIKCDQCMPSYYLIMGICQSCPNDCNQCSSQSQCTSCKDGFYQTQTSECLACSLPCLTCLSSNSNCLTCFDAANQILPECNCISTKFMNLQYQCESCGNHCAKCTISTCLTCVDSYYLSGTTCLQCSQLCATCETDSICLTCKDLNRTPPNCDCAQGYLLNIQDNQCEQCTFPCLTCQNSLTECLSCYDTYSHDQSNKKCNCSVNQAEVIDSTKYCVNCQLPCLTCVNSATECLTCASDTILSDTQCICQSEYDFFDPEFGSCKQCHLPCIKCISKLSCLQCNQDIQELFDCNCPQGRYMTQNYQCEFCETQCLDCTDSVTCKECNFGYYLSDSHVCIPCVPPCESCQNSGQQCQSCLNQLILSNDKCICGEKYYINTSYECLECQEPCFNCIDVANKCVDCIDNYILSDINTCICQVGFFQEVNYSPATCELCQSPCYECIGNENTCLSCIDENQILINQTCECKQGWLINNENMCDQCKLPCSSCQETLTQCMSCKDLDHTLINGQCVCSEHFGDDVNYNCIPCEPPCKKCQFTSSLCLTCISEQHVLTQQNECKCESGFMMNINKQCDACHISCKECELNVSNCIACKDLNHLLINGNCECKSGFISDLNFNCVPCQSPCQTCQMNTTLCLTCVSNDFYVNEQNKCVCVDPLKQNLQNKCECITGYYKKNEICHQCSFPCSECFNQNICLSCFNIDQVILKNNKCVCDSGYFWQKDYCSKCDKLCLTCMDDENNCTSCYQTSLRVLNNNKCVCQKGYYENSQNSCESCISDDGKIKNFCSVLNCNDKQWMYSEQCDDGNDVPRDGCTNCFIDKFYSCYNQIFQLSQCFQCPPNCKQCVMQEFLESVCIECDLGYFIDHYSCSKCSEKCHGCKNNPKNCIQCRFIKNSLGECQLCESQVGYYTNYSLNSCYTECGDGIKSKNEDCDDGNIIDGDGCDSQCYLEAKHHCENSICVIPSYPQPSLKKIGDISIYQQLRQFELTYNQELKFNSTFQLEDYFEIYILLDKKERKSDYQSSFIQNIDQISNNQFGFITLRINLIVHSDSSDEQILIKFNDQNEIVSNNGYSQQDTYLSCEIMPVIFIDQDAISQVQKVIASNKYILYILLAMSIGSILFGGIEIFYNLLDLLQFLSYLKYINTDLPYNMQEYFNLFDLFQFNFFTEYFDLSQNFKKSINFATLKKPPLKFFQEGLTPLFIINAYPLFLIWLSLACIYGISLLTPRILNKLNFKNDQIFQTNNQIYIKFVLLFYNLKIFVNQICYLIKSELFYSGIIRVYVSIAFDFAFSILLQINSLEFDSQDFLVQMSSYFSIFFAILYVMNIFIVVKISGISFYAIKNYYNFLKYGSIFEGVQIKNKICRFITSIQLVKKSIQMATLIFSSQFPIVQGLILIILSVFFCIYMVVFKPLNDKSEFIKQFTCEFNTLCVLINLQILIYDDQVKIFSYQIRQSIGWSCIFFLTTIIVVQMISDAIQQWRLLLKKYAKLKNFFKKLQNLLRNQNQQSAVPQLFLTK